MDKININIKVEDESLMPSYETLGSAGADLKANEEGVLMPGQRKLIKTGISIELPAGYEAQVRPRSGLALKHGISMVNTPGTIDSDYRGEIGIILINHSDRDFCVHNGDRIAQLVLSRVEKARFTVADSLAESGR